jgi:hypothetical protein
LENRLQKQEVDKPEYGKVCIGQETQKMAGCS